MNQKIKLTIDIDKKLNLLLKERSGKTGKSISELIEEIIKDKFVELNRIDPEIKKFEGILNTNKSYKELRDEIIKEKVEKYEGSN